MVLTQKFMTSLKFTTQHGSYSLLHGDHTVGSLVCANIFSNLLFQDDDQ